MEHCSLDPPTSDQYGLVVHSHSNYFSPIAFPAVAEVALRVIKLGKSSVSYEIGLFERDVPGVKAVGSFTHVFVDRSTGRPAANGMKDDLRRGLERIHVPSSSSKL